MTAHTHGHHHGHDHDHGHHHDHDHDHGDPGPQAGCAQRGEHGFLGEAHGRNEARTRWVIALTLATMAAEIWAGTVFGSMALVADGWHMATHAGALTITAAAYAFARRHAGDRRFSFGTGKVGDLAAFTSAIVLGLVALAIGWESLERLLSPRPISYDEAILVAVVGLLVNLASAALLHEGHGHAHGHDYAHGDHGHHHDQGHDHGRDLNLRSAYMHVLADALTSVLAIAGLLAGRQFGWSWVDPAVGVLGAVVIARWSVGLVRQAGAVLLDMVPDPGLAGVIRDRLEGDGARVVDLHLWRLGPGHMAVLVHLEAGEPLPAEAYKRRLEGLPCLSHVTVEVARG